MAYCSRQDLVDRIGEDLLKDLTDRESTGAINEERATQAMEDASAEIDSYAQERYTVPLSPVTRMVQSVAVDIAIYRLFLGRGYDAASADGAWAAQYRNAVAWLKSLAKGEAAIGAASPAEQGGQPSAVIAPDRVFDRETMKGF